MQPIRKSLVYTRLRTAQSMFAAAALLCACLLLVLYRDAARHGVLKGVYTCLNTLVPSLFPFVLLACLISRSRAAAVLFRPFSSVMRHIFRLPPCAAPALLLGLTAGYPVGAKMTAALYERGDLDREQAARLISFCTAPGYAFCVYTASRLSGGKHSALFLFCSTVLPPLLIGIIRARFAPKPTAKPSAAASGDDFTDAVRDGISAMVSMCGFVVVFSVLLAVFQVSGLFRAAVSLLSACGFTVPNAGALLLYFAEVTEGVEHSAYWHLPLSTAAFGLGFAGVCIHLQLFSFFRRKAFPIPKPLYFVLRLLTAVCSSVVCTWLTRLFPEAAAASAVTAPLEAVPAGSPALSAALLGLSVFFLAVCKNGDKTLKKV